MHTPWADAVESHRRETRAAILDATAAIVTEDGLTAVTLPRIAAKSGMTEARIHRYFPDLDAVLRAWHDRQVANDLGYLADVGDEPGTVLERIEAVLRAYAAIVTQTHQHHTTQLGASLHRTDSHADARAHLHHLVRTLLAEGAATGDIRTDLAPDELACRCLHALSSAGAHASAAAIRHLVTTTLDDLRHPSDPDRR